MRRLARMLLGSYFRRSAKNSFTGYFSWKYIHVNTHSHTHTHAHTQAVAQTNRQTLINNVGAGLASGSTVPGLGFWSTPGGAGVATAAPLSIHLALSSPSALGLCVWGWGGWEACVRLRKRVHREGGGSTCAGHTRAAMQKKCLLFSEEKG
jgi:hypothetical protein